MAKIGYGYGSEWHLLQYLGRRRGEFTEVIRRELTGVSSIHWLDHEVRRPGPDAREQRLPNVGVERAHAPTGASGIRELVGLEFMGPKDPVREEWERRWPPRGAVHWDAVGEGIEHGRKTWILVEAKANTGELKSSCDASDPESIQKIRKVLHDTRRDLRVTVRTDWTQDYYQYCNRIALLHFLREHEVDVHLIFVYFTGDRDDLGSPRKCPANEQDWRDALDAQDRHVGLPAESRISARVHRIFLPAHHVPIDERVLKPDYCRSKTPAGGRPPTQAAPRSPSPRDLADAFDQEMMQIYVRARQIGYVATRFHQMLVEHGGVETARRLLPQMSDGFTALYERNRLDLTVEALVLKPPWASLFSEDERRMARDRLKDCGWEIRPDTSV